tara:strand:+ start:56 stop:490 length:435 start_codon:yes stop_codon:yes gene_type:complete
VAEKPLLEEEKREEKKYLHKIILQMIKFQSLNKNIYFQQILKKENLSNNYFTIYFAKNFIEKNKRKNNLNVSFVVKKKIGNAVKRNKIKRKLKAAVQKILEKKTDVNLNYTYIIFGKKKIYSDKFHFLLKEMDTTFKKIKRLAN